MLLSERLDFHMINNLLISFHAFLMYMLTLLLVDAILLSRYVKWSANFRGLSSNVEIAPFCLKRMNSVLSEFTLRPKPLAAS